MMIHNRVTIGVLIFVVVVATALSIATLYLANQNRVAVQKAQKAIRRSNAALVTGRRADYNLCRTEMISRAVIDNARVEDKDKDDVIKFLPLFDCQPLLVGRQARRLSRMEALAFREVIKKASPDSNVLLP